MLRGMMESEDSDLFEQYQRTRRRALAFLGGGLLLIVLNAAYLADKLRYFTVNASAIAYALYVVGLVLAALGARTWAQAAALKARITAGL